MKRTISYVYGSGFGSRKLKFDLRSELFRVFIALIYGSRILKITCIATPPAAVAFAAAAKAAASSAAPMFSCCCHCAAATAAAAAATTTTAAAAFALALCLSISLEILSYLRCLGNRVVY